MLRRLVEIVEVVTLIATIVLAYLWASTKDGNYEPYTYICGVIFFLIEFYRRWGIKDTPGTGGLPEDTAPSLLSWLIANAPARDLSETLPRAFRLAQKLGDRDFERWVRCELYGYDDDNMADGDEVPRYRAVVGRYFNRFGQRLELDDPKLGFANEDRLRLGVRQLEEYSKKRAILFIANDDMLQIIRENLEFDAVRFGFNPTAVVGVLEAIRGRLMDRVHAISDGGVARPPRQSEDAS
jgi:hypothetical protein